MLSLFIKVSIAAMWLTPAWCQPAILANGVVNATGYQTKLTPNSVFVIFGNLLGGAALVLTASQLIDEPPAVALSDFELQTGAWLALAGSALLLAGAFMSVARVSFSVEHREPRPATPPPETETVKLRPPDETG